MFEGNANEVNHLQKYVPVPISASPPSPLVLLVLDPVWSSSIPQAGCHILNTLLNTQAGRSVTMTG